MEKAESSSLEVLRELAAREPCLEFPRELFKLDDDPLRAGYRAEATAFAMFVSEAASCSGGEAFHLSSGFISEISTPFASFGWDGISMAPITGDDGPDDGRTLPRRRALANQLEIWLLLSPVDFFNSSFSRSLGYG